MSKVVQWAALRIRLGKKKRQKKQHKNGGRVKDGTDQHLRPKVKKKKKKKKKRALGIWEEPTKLSVTYRKDQR